MTTTQQILTTFTSKVDLEKEYTRSELGKMLTEVFKEIREGEKGEKRKKVKKEVVEEKKKREPTAYNLFVKERMSVVREENPEMSRQDLMREIGRMWKERKEDVVEVVEEKKEKKKRGKKEKE
jgi:FMN phosphatase YigB (HAD superfamily)